MTTEGADVLPFHAVEVGGDVSITFGFDLEVAVGFVRAGVTLWSNAGNPSRLSDLIAEHAGPDDLADVARDLALRLLRKRAESSGA